MSIVSEAYATADADDQLRQAIGGWNIAKLYSIFDALSKWVLVFGLIAGVIVLLWGAIILIRSYGSEEQTRQGKKTLTWAVTGIIVLLLARGGVLIVGQFIGSGSAQGGGSCVVARQTNPHTECQTNTCVSVQACGLSVDCATCAAAGQVAISFGGNTTLQEGQRGVVTAQISGGTRPYRCQWNGSAGTTGTSCTSAFLSSLLLPGVYLATLRVTDGNGIITTRNFSVTVAQQVIPERWNGITYYANRHHFYNMLNDWYTVDASAAMTVANMADRDMALLAANGFNFLHLYLWDNVWFGIGFNPVSQDPKSSANNQWGALDDFLTRAWNHGLYVGVHFVSKPTIDRLNQNLTVSEAQALGAAYAQWANVFVQNLAPRHRNILLWGLVYGFGPAAGAGGDQNPWNAFFKAAYPLVRNAARQAALAPGLGRIGINLTFPFSALPDRYQYAWDALDAQRQAKVLIDMGLPEPDVWMLQLYNANSLDLEKSLQALAGSPLAADALSVRPEKILAVEFGNSSSLAPPPFGMQVAGKGDADTPSVTLDGQARWLANTLAAFSRINVQKMAYWTLYDAHSFWASPPHNMTGAGLAWNGYWGLYADSNAAKPALSTLANFYKTQAVSTANPPSPVVALYADQNTVCAGQTFSLGWTATDVSYMEITNGVGQVFGSLGSVTVTPPAAGALTYTVNAKNTNGASLATSSAAVTVNVVSCP